MLGREGHDPKVDHLEHLTPTHVDESEKALERAGVAVVLFGLPQVSQTAGDPASLFVAKTERTGRPGVDLHEGPVDDAASFEGGIPLGMVVERRQDHDRLFHLERRSYVAHDLPTVDLASRHRDDDFDDIGLRALEQDEAQPPVGRHGLACIDSTHHLLGGSNSPI